MAWLENRMLEKVLRRWLVSLAACGALLACKETEKPAPDHQGKGGDGTSGSGIGGGLSVSGTSGISGSTAGGAPAEEVKGERGSSCDSSRDCEDGLSCIVTANCPAGVPCANKTCQPSNFEIVGTGKQCHVVDCATRKDCCGDMPLDAPAKCDVRDIVCTRPTLAGCTAISCQEDDQCGAGKCAGLCAYDSSPTTTVSCQTVDDCEENVCVLPGGTGGTGGTAGTGGAGGAVDLGGTGGTAPVIGRCSLTNTTCQNDAGCVKNSCSARSCRCQNPEYDPTDPICEDEDCEGICGFTCENERCVVDKSCRVDSECASTLPFCDDGTCVECKTADDCEDEPCIDGRCGPECKVDTQCGLFEVCRQETCVYVGCQTDRECILSARAQASDRDPRLFVCRIDQGIGTCVFPCEIDAQCAVSEICVDSVCQYIGCETHAECKTIAGLHNQPPPSDAHPWTTTAECRAEPGN